MSDDLLTGILKLTREEVLRIIRTVGLEKFMQYEYENDYETEDLQGLLYSFFSSTPNSDRHYELADYFMEDFHLVQALVEGDGRVTIEVVEQLVEQAQRRFLVPVCVSCSETTGVAWLTPETVIYKHAGIIAVDCVDYSGGRGQGQTSVSCVDGLRLCSSQGHTKKSGKQLIKYPLPFGMHNLQVAVSLLPPHRYSDYVRPAIVATGGRQRVVFEQRVLISSPTYTYVSALDALFDRMLWGWEGDWTERLETALLEMVISIDEELTTVVVNLVNMMNMMKDAASTGATEMKHMLDSVVSDVQMALRDHSTYAVGRLHQTLVQFLELHTSMQWLIRMPPNLTEAIKNFMIAKLAAAVRIEMRSTMQSLVVAALEFDRELQNCPATFSVTRQLKNIQSFLHCARDAGVSIGTDKDHVIVSESFEFGSSLFHAVLDLKPSGMDLMADLSYQKWNSYKIDHLPFIPEQALQDSTLLHQTAHNFCETLLMDAIQLQSIMGYTMTPTTVPQTASLICALLDAGFAYVASDSGKLMALLPMQRAMLVLNKPTPTTIEPTTNLPIIYDKEWAFHMPVQLQKRVKDMNRVFRNNVKDTLSLRLNSDFSLAMQRLREHHAKDCWVGPDLEAVWRSMCSTQPFQMLIFELWYGNVLIAADYAHPVNSNGVYVATRFFDRSEEYRRLVPGFLLALAVTKFLRDIGCSIWDLGTANLCPLMRYKLDLTGKPYSRVEALYELSSASCSHASQSSSDTNRVAHVRRLQDLAAGVLVANISISDLLGGV